MSAVILMPSSSFSCDGSVKLWDLKTKTVLKTVVEVVVKSNDITNRWTFVLRVLQWSFLFSSSMVHLDFSPCGQHLAVPAIKGVVVVSR